MARVYLISCNVTTKPYPVFPIGMAMVASAARNAGHEVREFDLLASGGDVHVAAEEARRFRPDVVGLSIRNIDNVDSTDYCAYHEAYGRLVDALRDRCNCPIVLGGAGFSLFPSELLECLQADLGVVGEGEREFCRLIDDLSNGGGHEQRLRVSASPLAGEEIEMPVRSQHIASYYRDNGGMLNIQTKRGCPLKCAYCTYPKLEGQNYRFRPAATVVDEIETLMRDHHVDYISMTDSVFNDRSGHFLEVAEEIVRRNLNIKWMAFFRPQYFNKDDVKLLKRSGLSAVEWGTDAACDATLEGLRKGFDWTQVAASSKSFEDAQIPAAHFIIFGGPGETEKTVDEGIANIHRLKNSVVFVFNGIRVLPGTSIYKTAVDEKVLESSHNLLEPFFYFSPYIQQEELESKLYRAFSQHKTVLFPPGKNLDLLNAFHKLRYHGPVWDHLLKNKNTVRRAVLNHE